MQFLVHKTNKEVMMIHKTGWKEISRGLKLEKIPQNKIASSENRTRVAKWEVVYSATKLQMLDNAINIISVNPLIFWELVNECLDICS